MLRIETTLEEPTQTKLYIRKARKDRDPHKRDRLNLVDMVIDENVVRRWDLMVFAINTNGGKGLTRPPNHWSLLVYNPFIPKWTLYNSMRSRDKKRDGFLLDATYVKNYVEERIEEVYNRLLKQGIQPDTPLHENTPIEACEEFPQQKENSDDCGYFVCMAMESIANSEAMPTAEMMKKDPELLAYKSVLVSRLIQDYAFPKNYLSI